MFSTTKEKRHIFIQVSAWVPVFSCLSVCALMWDGCTCMWRSEDNLRCQFPLSTLFETGSFLVLHCICQTSWSQSFWGCSCLCFPSPHRSDYTQARPHLAFYINSGDSNSGPQTCKASTLPTEPSLQPIFISFGGIPGSGTSRSYANLV